MPVSEGQDLLYSAVLEQSGIILLSLILGVAGLEGVPGLGPIVAACWPDTSPSPLLPQHVAHCDTNISSVPGEGRSSQVALPYAATACVVFGLRVNGSLLRRDKIHLWPVATTSEREEALRLTS